MGRDFLKITQAVKEVALNCFSGFDFNGFNIDAVLNEQIDFALTVITPEIKFRLTSCIQDILLYFVDHQVFEQCAFGEMNIQLGKAGNPQQMRR